MPEIRQDPTTREWVIIATERAKRPHEFRSLATHAERVCWSCVFCPGNESQATPEVWRLERNGHWRVRGVANKFPALTGEATGFRHETPPFYRWMDGFGYHEVIIETPEHDRTLPCMGEDELVDVLLTYRQRYQTLRADPRVKLVLLFKNHGERAGTSIVHPHSHQALEDPHFNLLILTAPVEDESKAYFLWHIEIIPRLTTPAGFELGSGMQVNLCVPEEAARFLREAKG